MVDDSDVVGAAEVLDPGSVFSCGLCDPWGGVSRKVGVSVTGLWRDVHCKGRFIQGNLWFVWGFIWANRILKLK